MGSPFDVTGIDVIELLPVNNREGTVRESPKAFVDVPSQETKVLEMVRFMVGKQYQWRITCVCVCGGGGG